MIKSVLWITACLMLTVAAPVLAEADPVADAARDIMKSYEKAIVHVEAVVKITATGGGAMMKMPDQEQKVKVLGTIIDPSGLTVVPSLDPTKALGEVKINAGGQAIKLKFKGEVREVKYRLADGTEVPARLVMTDDDLSLAFVAPEKPFDKKTLAKIAHVDLKKAAGKPSMLDKIITLGRFGKTLNHTLNVKIGRIGAIVTKPRIFYVGSGSLGSPVFASDGKLLGICTRRATKGGRSRSIGMMSALGGGGAAASGAPVILPAADVKEIADQAKDEMTKAKTEN
jgi:hypothetical protein